MAYLISRYPAISHTFILREILELKKLGFQIQTASVNLPDNSQEMMGPDELGEMQSTYYLKKDGVWGAVQGHMFFFFSPLTYLKGLIAALKFGQFEIKKTLFGFFYFTEALMIKRWMRKNNTHHLHVHFATAAANIALILKAISSVSISMTIHGPDEFYDVEGQKLVEKIEMSDFLICISSFAKSQVMKFSKFKDWRKFDICPLGVNRPLLKQQSVDQSEPKTDVFTILCVGRLTKAKGQHVLIEACSMLRDKGKNFKLVMVGHGPDELSLKATVKELGLDNHVVFTGAQNQLQVAQWYSVSDAFVLPSFAEGVPVVLMEAMASKVPCVTTRITGIPELIRDGIEGILVTPSDAYELSDAIASLMEDQSLCFELAEAAYTTVSKKYDLQTNVARLSQIFKTRLSVA
jgi:glycosyltransferase involved in cell wall biosynthesis